MNFNQRVTGTFALFVIILTLSGIVTAITPINLFTVIPTAAYFGICFGVAFLICPFVLKRIKLE